MRSKLLRFAAGGCAVLITFFLSGCGYDVIRSNSDEIRLSSWQYSSDAAQASLTFEGDSALLELKSGSDFTKIKGLCVIDDSAIALISPDDSLVFDYTLTGKTLTLEADGYTLVLQREG